MTHRGGRVLAERAEIIRILSGEVFLCWDCRSAKFRVEHDGARFVIALYHLRECPVHRSGWSVRVADDYVRAVLIMGGMVLADYCDPDLAHR